MARWESKVGVTIKDLLDKPLQSLHISIIEENLQVVEHDEPLLV